MREVLCGIWGIGMVDKVHMVKIHVPLLACDIEKPPISYLPLFGFTERVKLLLRNIYIKRWAGCKNDLTFFDVLISKDSNSVNIRSVEFVFDVNHWLAVSGWDLGDPSSP